MSGGSRQPARGRRDDRYDDRRDPPPRRRSAWDNTDYVDSRTDNVPKIWDDRRGVWVVDQRFVQPQDDRRPGWGGGGYGRRGGGGVRDV
jgi:hypothetical protein